MKKCEMCKERKNCLKMKVNVNLINCDCFILETVTVEQYLSKKLGEKFYKKI